MKPMKTKILRRALGVSSLLMLALGVGVALRVATAGVGESGFGWLWGGSESVSDDVMNGTESGFGWISMNDTNAGSGGGNYGVNIPSADGALSGYAWTEHYGWISFNGADLAGCVPALGQAARTGNNITGGARILSIRDAGTNAGGWDGCVSLSGSTPNYGVTVSGSALAGYAWSGELGWIDFSRASIVPSGTIRVCREGIPISGSGLNFSLAPNQSTNLKVYFDDGAGCGPSGNDVTSIAAWTDIDNNAPASAITLSSEGTNPRVATAGSVSSISDTVSVQYAGQTVTMVIGVSCVETACTGKAEEYCQGQPYSETATSACSGGPITCSGTGARYCDFNWKEVAPGQ